MALNEVYKEADSLNYAVDATVDSGDFVVLGGIVGVAEVDAKLGADGDYYATLRHKGVFIGTTADAVTVGAPIYLADAETFGTPLTTDDDTGANALVGHAVRAKDAGAGDVHVRINN